MKKYTFVSHQVKNVNYYIIKLLFITRIKKTCKWRKAKEKSTNNYAHCNKNNQS